MANFVMIIDDSLTVRKIIESSLRREGIEAAAFEDGLSALDALHKGDVPVPDLILLDIGLPKLDGYEIARLIKEKKRYSNTIIVMLSGRDGVFDKLKGKMAGAKDYITKPFKPTEVLAAVKEHLHITGANSNELS